MRRILATPRGPWEALLAEAPLAAEEEAPLVVEGEIRLVEAEVVHLLQHLPAVVMAAVEEEVPLVVEARHPSSVPRRWLRNRLPNLLLLEAEGAVEVSEAMPPLWRPPVAEETRRASRTLHWLLLLPVAARTTRRLHQHPRRRPN